MPNPATIDDFFALIVRSGLLPEHRLRAFRAAAPDAEPDSEAVARRLVRDRLLTSFQARSLLRGRYRGFFLNDKYKILDMIGEGGMGRVLLCEHLILHRLVAVKVLHPAGQAIPGAAERFLREARAAAALDHPNIVRIFDVDKAGATPFMVMEYADGSNLHQVVGGHGPLSVGRAAEYIRQAAVGLAHAHGAGQVHRDVKPSNLLLDRTGTVKLLDMGLVRFFDTRKNADLTQRFDDKTILGTADFISPEQAMDSSTVDPRSDIYSLGYTVYFLLTGQLPFAEANSAQKLLYHQLKEPKPLRDIRPDLPLDLVAVVGRMIRKAPAERIQTADEVAEALRPFADRATAPPSPEEMPRAQPGSYVLGLVGPPSGAFTVSGGPAPETPTPAGGAEGDAAPTARTEPRSPYPKTAAGRGPRSKSGGMPPSDVLLASALSPALSMPPSRTRQLPPTAPRSPLVPAHPVEPSEPPEPPESRGPTDPPRKGSRIAPVAAVLLVGLLLAGLGYALWSPARTPVIPVPQPTPGPGPSHPPTPTPTPATGKTLKSGGSTAIKPLMDFWKEEYLRRTGTAVGYDGGGSGSGVRRTIDRALDFGCTDAPLTDEQTRSAAGEGGEVIHVPLSMGAVVATYNLPDVSGPIKFTGPLLADIYLGRIGSWNHEAIRANNPGVALPNLPIVVVRRQDGSGTTFIWTDYLSKVSGEWRQKVGAKTDPAWPAGADGKPFGLAGKGNDGVAREVKRNPGSIGYVELSYAVGDNLPAGWVKNGEGRMVAPSFEGVTAAAAALLTRAPGAIPDDLRYSLTDAPGEDSYPIAGTTWAVLYAKQPADKKDAVVAFLNWAAHEGQAFAREQKYAPLPAELVARIDEKLKRVTAK